MDKTIQKRRSQSDVMIEILEICCNPIRPTRLLGLGNVCFKQFQQFYNKLSSLGFLTKVPTGNKGRFLIQTTDQGKEFLVRFKKLNSLISDS